MTIPTTRETRRMSTQLAGGLAVREGGWALVGGLIPSHPISSHLMLPAKETPSPECRASEEFWT